MRETKICPKGHIMHKKGNGSQTATQCPNDEWGGLGKCVEYDNCKFNHNVMNCYYCLECNKHYEYVKPIRVMFT